MANVDWLGQIPSTRRLNQLILPGSHDAGVYGDSLTTTMATKGLSRCQGSDIAKQAASGSRMFDCRVFLRTVKNPETKQKEVVPTMGHFAKESKKGKGSFGAYGGTLITVIDDAVTFVKKNPTEFLLLRFSHTYCPEEVGELIKQKFPIGNTSVFANGACLALTTLASLRGKVAMVFASEFHKGFSPQDGFLPFRKYTGTSSAASGLTTCGIYKGSTDMGKVHENAAKAAADHKAHADNAHLHFVYWQQTGGNVEDHTTEALKVDKKTGAAKAYTGGAHANLDGYCDEIVDKVTKGVWKIPNVISHDFVNDTTCSTIIDLNNRIPSQYL